MLFNGGEVIQLSSPDRAPLRQEDYQALAEFRHALRKFVAFSEDAARASGLTPQQHQAILAIKGFSGAGPISVGDLAAQLLIRHHSAVELVDRLVKGGLASRTEDPGDARRVIVALTAKAETILEELSATHLAELRRSGTLLTQMLQRLES